MSIKDLRNHSRLSTTRAVEMLGISLSYLYKIECGNKIPGRDLIKRMSSIYGCSLNDIFLAINTTKSGNGI